MVRRPAVAGSFYPGTATALKAGLIEMIPVNNEKKKVIGLVSPHAGYVYSGGCAGKGYAAIEVPDLVIVLGVNHRGVGHSFAVDGSTHWNTPFGDVPVAVEVAQQLVEHSNIFAIDNRAGQLEHSLEVQVPFIQYINPNASILPITVSSMNLGQLQEAAKELATLIKSRQEEILMVASTDMSHYISAEEAKEEDQKAIDKLLEMDPEGLFDVVLRERISMCGMAPTTIMLSAAKQLGARKSEIVQYTNSGEVSGDFYQVVGYLSMLVY